MLQELPYEKRDGARVADAYLYALAYDNAKSTSESCSLLNMLEFVPETVQALKDDPESVIEKLEAVRRCCECCDPNVMKILMKVLDPSLMRVSVRGDILSLPNPRSALARSFLAVKVSPSCGS